MLSFLAAGRAAQVLTNDQSLSQAHPSKHPAHPPSQRVIRIFKLGRYTDGSSLLRETLRASSAAVGLMAFFMIVLTLLFASIVYFAEMGKFKVTPVSLPSLISSLPPCCSGRLTCLTLSWNPQSLPTLAYLSSPPSSLPPIPQDFPDGNYFRRNVHGGQEELSPFTSIPVAAYWVIMTATTVGCE